MRLPPLHRDREAVARGHDAAGPHHQAAGRPEPVRAEHVQAEDRLDLGLIERSCRDHSGGPALLAGRHAFFGRLEHEYDRSGQMRFHRAQNGRRAEEHRRVRVVPARVHHADLLAFVLSGTVDLNGRSTCSVTGSASMSARNATTGPGRPPRRTPTTPLIATPVRTSSPSRRQFRRDDAGRAHFAVAELGMLVQVTPPRDHLRIHVRRPPIDLLVDSGRRDDCLGPHRRGEREHDRHRENRAANDGEHARILARARPSAPGGTGTRQVRAHAARSSSVRKPRTTAFHCSGESSRWGGTSARRRRPLQSRADARGSRSGAGLPPPAMRGRVGPVRQRFVFGSVGATSTSQARRYGSA